MYTVAVRKNCGESEEFERYEVHKDVYFYIRQLEVGLCREETAKGLRFAYPNRFPAFQGEKDE